VLFLLAASSTSCLIKLNSSFSLFISSCCSNWRSLRSSRIFALRFVTCSICSSSSVVNKSSSFLFVSIIGSIDLISGLVLLLLFDISGCVVTISGCNVAVWTSGNKTFSPF
jgi:hypothetical protein